MITAPPDISGQKEFLGFNTPTSSEQTMCELFLTHGHLRNLKPKEALFHKGDPAKEVYLIFKGQVQVSVPSVDGKEMTFAILGPGQLVGEVAVLTGNPRPATVMALEPTTVSVVKRTVLFSLMAQFPEMVFFLSRTLAARLEYTSDLLEDLVFLNLGPRLAKRLLALAETFGRKTSAGMTIDLLLHQHLLGTMVGASRESVNKQLRLWEASGIVQLHHGRLVLKDLHFLRKSFDASCRR